MQVLNFFEKLKRSEENLENVESKWSVLKNTIHECAKKEMCDEKKKKKQNLGLISI